MIFFMAGIIDN